MDYTEFEASRDRSELQPATAVSTKEKNTQSIVSGKYASDNLMNVLPRNLFASLFAEYRLMSCTT